jgi:hypothetical protein
MLEPRVLHQHLAIKTRTTGANMRANNIVGFAFLLPLTVACATKPDVMDVCRLVDPHCGKTELQVEAREPLPANADFWPGGHLPATELQERGPTHLVPSGSRVVSRSATVELARDNTVATPDSFTTATPDELLSVWRSSTLRYRSGNIGRGTEARDWCRPYKGWLGWQKGLYQAHGIYCSQGRSIGIDISCTGVRITSASGSQSKDVFFTKRPLDSFWVGGSDHSPVVITPICPNTTPSTRIFAR